MEDDKKPSQRWQDIARQASQEQDPQRLGELTEKLLNELENEDSKKKQQGA